MGEVAPAMFAFHLLSNFSIVVKFGMANPFIATVISLFMVIS
jgi:hypothetical protein